MEYKIKSIAHIENDFNEKFGIPRQGGLLEDFVSYIYFEKEYNNEQAFREIKKFSHLWLLWIFSENLDKKISLTVRPPRLGGNKRIGVFASRSPYRPNSIGMSCVKLLDVIESKDKGIVLKVSGADLLSGTPIIDIKPYVKIGDCRPEAVCGFSDEQSDYKLDVVIPDTFNDIFDETQIKNLKDILSYDPRPAYHDDDDRVYKMRYSNYDISFTVKDNFLYVTDVKKENE